MRYTTFAEVKEIVKGREIMLDLLEGHAADRAAIDNDAAAHPYFDMCVSLAEGEINDALAAAGLEYPVVDATDTRLRFAAGCLTVDKLAPADNRSAYTSELAALGRAYLDDLRSGALVVIGAEESPTAASGVVGRRVDVPMFDTLDGEPSLMDYLMPSLGRDPRRWQ